MILFCSVSLIWYVSGLCGGWRCCPAGSLGTSFSGHYKGDNAALSQMQSPCGEERYAFVHSSSTWCLIGIFRAQKKGKEVVRHIWLCHLIYDRCKNPLQIHTVMSVTFISIRKDMVNKLKDVSVFIITQFIILKPFTTPHHHHHKEAIEIWEMCKLSSLI